MFLPEFGNSTLQITIDVSDLAKADIESYTILLPQRVAGETHKDYLVEFRLKGTVLSNEAAFWICRKLKKAVMP